MTLKAKLGLVAATALVVGAVGGYGVASLAHRQEQEKDNDREEPVRVVSLANASIRVSSFAHLLKGFRAGEKELMIDRLENQIEIKDPIRVQGKLIVRESCGAEQGEALLERYVSHTNPPEPLIRRWRGKNTQE